MVSKNDWSLAKVKKEFNLRSGEKYDEEGLLEEELENLDTLDEEEMRRRLKKLELDHDRRNQEMVTCIDELKKANERVSGYSRAIDKREKGDEGRFNVKEYVFQLGRHFCHNISNIEGKIRQLRQSLSPVEDSGSQTDGSIVTMSHH